MQRKKIGGKVQGGRRSIDDINTHHMTDSEMLQCFQDTGREIDKLCSFLGLSPTAEDREKVITGVSFDSMKKNNMTNYSTAEGLDHKVSPFMRKGTFLRHFVFFSHMKM